MYEEEVKKGLEQSTVMRDSLFETHEEFMKMKRAGKAHNINIDEIMAQVKLNETHGRKVMEFFHAMGAFNKQKQLAHREENMKDRVK